MKIFFNLIDACTIRHTYAKLFDTPASNDVFFRQWGYCCNKCKMNALSSCRYKTCEDVLKDESKNNSIVWRVK